MQSCSKMLKVLQLHIKYCLIGLFQIVEQFQHVTLVGIQCIGRVSALQFQVTTIGA